MRFSVRIGFCAAFATAVGGNQVKNVVAAFLITGMLVASSAFAQTVNGSIGGTVTDASGAVIPNATVTAVGIDTGVTTKTTTNATGSYEFPSLPQGNYRVSAEMTGFQEAVISPVVLDVTAQVRLNLTLSVAGGASRVEVVAAGESPLLTSSAIVAGVVTGQQILDHYCPN